MSDRKTSAPQSLRLTAIIAGLIGFLCFVATPLLPVNQTQSSFDWPQQDSLQSINAPLISVAPEEIDAEIPLGAVDKLRDGQDLLYGTIPPESKKASNRGMFVRAGEDGLSVTSLDEVVFSLTPEQVAKLPDDASLRIDSTEEATTVSLGTYSKTSEEDLRPQVTGVYLSLIHI